MSETRRAHALKQGRRRLAYTLPGVGQVAPVPQASCVLLAGLLLWSAVPAQAQDMSFGIEETSKGRRAANPPSEGPPSEALANALRLYQEERYQEAGVLFQRVIEGETNEAAGNLQKAQFFLGKALYHLHYYQSALTVFDEISQVGRGHLFFEQTLQWLAQLASQLPDSAGIIEKVGRYGTEQVEQFNTSDNIEVYNQLVYLMGRSKYQQGEFDGAINLFQRIRSSSPWYVKAKFFEGIAYIRMRKAQPATVSFRAILEALEQGEAKVDEEARMRDLAWISLARTYYTAANRTDDGGDRQVDGRLLGNAVEAWTKIGEGSEYWLDSMFEASWALFLADQYSRALGNVHTLYSPYFKDAFYPEALVLKAVVFFSNCQMKNAQAVVQLFHEKYDPMKEKLDQMLEQYSDNQQFFDFLQRLRAGEGNLPEEVRGIIASALSDRTVLRNLEYVRLLEEEEKRLNTEPPAFKSSSVGARILQDILVAKSFAVDQAGDLAKGRYNRLLDELQDLFNQIDTVDLEVATFERGQLSQEMQEQQTAAAESGGGKVEVDSEHMLWPFNGEYWRDELGFYRQEVTYQCGR